MAFAPQKLDASRPRCHLATTFAQVFEQSMLSRVTATTTAEEFQALQQSLIRLCLELEQQADWRHYQAAGTLRHCCVRDTYTQAAFILKNCSLTQPAPPAPPPPAPPPPQPKPRSLTDVVKDFAAMPEETRLPAEDKPDGE
jgi:hypothetical protein